MIVWTELVVGLLAHMVRRTPTFWCVWVVLSVMTLSCSSLPPLEEQKRLVEQNNLRVRQLTPRAFLDTWGQPTYLHHQFTHFYGMKDGRLIPQARLALGEAPQGWETSLEAGDALFLAYADRGMYLVFLEEQLVYHEAMPADKVHAVGKSWKYEEQFKTRLDSLPR